MQRLVVLVGLLFAPVFGAINPNPAMRVIQVCIEEPAAAGFSLSIFFLELAALWYLQRRVGPRALAQCAYPARGMTVVWVWTYLWSALFHMRETLWTERLDYFSSVCGWSYMLYEAVAYCVIAPWARARRWFDDDFGLFFVLFFVFWFFGFFWFFVLLPTLIVNPLLLPPTHTHANKKKKKKIHAGERQSLAILPSGSGGAGVPLSFVGERTMRALLAVPFVYWNYQFLDYMLHVRFDYGYAVQSVITFVIAHAALWLVWAARHHARGTRPLRCLLPIVLTHVAIGCAAPLELYDFVPIWGIFDGHSLWHGAGMLIAGLFALFIIEEVKACSSGAGRDVKAV
jgi:hypothetical protein